MKRTLICFLIVILSAGAVFGQDEETETPLLEILSSMADESAGAISRSLRNGGALYIDDITFMNRSSQLGELFNSVLLARLSSAEIRNLSLYGKDAVLPESPNSSVYILSGEIYRLSDEIYLSLNLIKGWDNQIILVKEYVIPMTREVAMMFSGGFSAGGTGGDEFEPNNDPLGAYRVELNTVVDSLSLSPSGDQDWFFLEITDDDTSFLSIGTTGSLDTVMDFYGPDTPDNLIASNDDGDNGSNALVQTTVSVPGIYFIKVAGYGSDVQGSYGLFINKEEYVQEEGEPNNSREEAEYVQGISVSLEKKLFPMGDEDWYKLDFTGIVFGEEDSVRVKTSGALDTYMDLYMDGSLILSNDDGGSDGNASVVFTPETEGDYYVLVRGYDASAIGDYTLEIETIVLELDSYEPDDSREDATYIEMNSTQKHTLIMSDELDWYTFTLERPDNINFETYGEMDTYVIMYDSQGNIIQESDDDGTGYNGKISMYLERGTYYCTVALYSSGGEVTEYTAGLSSN